MQTPIIRPICVKLKKSLTICLARHRLGRPHRGSGHRDTLQGPALQGQLCSPYSHIHFQMMHLQEYNRSRDLLNLQHEGTYHDENKQEGEQSNENELFPSLFPLDLHLLYLFRCLLRFYDKG